MSDTLLEVCCGSFQDAVRAEKGGADRIELNTAMLLGGLSCGRTLLRQVRENVNIPVMCMVRCKSGGFYYTDDELDLMFNQASQLLERGADGIVFGFLNADKTINVERVREMTDLVHSYNRPAVFHRAFDAVPDKDTAAQQLIEIGIDRILTSGSPGPQIDIDMIEYLQNKYGDQIEILPCGGITDENILEIKEKTGCTQFHSSCKCYKPDYPGDETMMHEEVDQEVVEKIKSII